MNASAFFDSIEPSLSWGAWRAFVRAVYGEPLEHGDLEIFRKHTGRQWPREGGYPEAVLIVGRQSGKTKCAAILAAFEALQARAGEHSLLVAQDIRGASRALYGYCERIFEQPVLAQAVTRRTNDTLELATGSMLSVYPCRPAALRGVRARVAILDELAFYLSSEGRPTDREMLRAARPTLATTSGRLIVLSSPYAQTGALWELHRNHYGVEDSPVLVWQASASDMNPTLPADYLARMLAEDPEAYRSEVLGEFRAGLSSLLDPDALDAVVARDRREILPAPGNTYRAFVDPSGGRSDAFALAIGRRAGERIVLDCVRAWRPPFNPTGVVGEAAELLKRYRITSVTGDKYAGEWPREAFRAHGIEYRVAEATASDAYLALVPAVNAGAVELLDNDQLLRELRCLERRRGPSGKDRVDHPRGGHDDVACAVAGLVAMLPKRATSADFLESTGSTSPEMDAFRGREPGRLSEGIPTQYDYNGGVGSGAFWGGRH